MARPTAQDDWIIRYEHSHMHPVNRLCHTVGIPLIVISLALGLVSIVVASLRLPALLAFVVGWALQFVGHAIEGKPPEFFRDWRFLFVGFRWWLLKIRGRV